MPSTLQTHLVLFADGLAGAETAQLLAFGASACLARNTQARDVRNTIHLASRGLQVTPLAATGSTAVTARARDPLLTAREGDVLLLLRQGHANGQIALELHIGTETVRTHTRHIYRKLASPRRSLLALPHVALAGYRVTVSGVPPAMRRASQVMARVESRTQPCETAVPSVPDRPLCSVHGDLARSALELLEHAGSGAGGQREGTAVRSRGERECLLHEEPPARCRGRARADDGAEAAATRPAR